jgi:hypothetical protein
MLACEDLRLERGPDLDDDDVPAQLIPVDLHAAHIAIAASRLTAASGVQCTSEVGALLTRRWTNSLPAPAASAAC